MLKKIIGLCFLLPGIGLLVMACNFTWTTGSGIEDGLARVFQTLLGILFVCVGVQYPRSEDRQTNIN